MGLLNNWLHKKKKEQLNKTGAKARQVEVAAPDSAKDTSGKETKTVVHKEKDQETKKHKVKLSADSAAFRILVKPLVTEKSAVAESINKYSFVVARSASKNQVKKAVTEIYGVKPVAVNVANVEGRRLRFGRSAGRRSDFKKAIVTLPAGKTIDIHTGV